MKTLIVLLRGDRHNAAFPPLAAAAMVYKKALDFHCDRIRVEVPGGVRVADFSTDQVAAYVCSRRLALQPDRPSPRGRVWEPHHPVWALKASAPKET